MKKLILIAMLLGLYGCAGFNPNNRGIYFSDGKPYRIPYNSSTKLVDKDMAAGMKKLGIYGCNENNIVWISQGYGKKYMKNWNETPENKKEQIVRNGFNKQLMGCSSVMSDQELNYYSAKEQQQQQQQAAQQTYQYRPTHTNCTTLYGNTNCYSY